MHSGFKVQYALSWHFDALAQIQHFPLGYDQSNEGD